MGLPPFRTAGGGSLWGIRSFCILWRLLPCTVSTSLRASGAPCAPLPDSSFREGRGGEFRVRLSRWRPANASACLCKGLWVSLRPWASWRPPLFSERSDFHLKA